MPEGHHEEMSFELDLKGLAKFYQAECVGGGIPKTRNYRNKSIEAGK